VARGEFELAAVLDGSMTPAQARQFYKDRIAAIYGVSRVVVLIMSFKKCGFNKWLLYMKHFILDTQSLFMLLLLKTSRFFLIVFVMNYKC